jgi:signal peptidase
MENTKVERTKKELAIYIAKIVGNVVFYAVIVMLLLFSIMNINAGSKNGGFPNIFGRGFLSVQTNSMVRNENGSYYDEVEEAYADYAIEQFAKGDLVHAKVIKEKNFNNLQVGDVITFYDENLKALNTHRIVYIDRDADNNIKLIAVQGDKVASELGIYDPTDDSKFSLNQALQDNGHVTELSGEEFEYVKGIVYKVKVGGGAALENVQKNWLWYFVIPVLVFLLVEVYFVVKNVMELKGAKQKAELASDKEQMMAELEAQKEEMRRQILAELQAQSQGQATNGEESNKDESK